MEVTSINGKELKFFNESEGAGIEVLVLSETKMTKFMYSLKLSIINIKCT